jgi:hypothetical protein
MYTSNPSSTRTYTHFSPRFSGQATTKAAQKYLFEDSPDHLELSWIGERDKNPYVGSLPSVFFESSNGAQPLDSKTVLKDLDTLAHVLSRFEFIHWLRREDTQVGGHRPASPLPPLVWKRPAGNDIKIQVLGYGWLGIVSLLTVGHQNYAMKSFYDNPKKFAYQEANLGLYLTEHGNTKNFSKYYCGNPEGPKGRWSLVEYIAPDMWSRQRGGKPFEEAGISFVDAHVPENRINDIRVDPGSWMVHGRNNYKYARFMPMAKNVVEFREILSKEPQNAQRTLLESKQLEPDERLKIFLEALKNKETRQLAVMYCSDLSPSDYKTFFDKAMAYPGLRGKTAKMEAYLTGAERQDAWKTIRSFDECKPYRIYKGEDWLLPELLKKEAPSLDLQIEAG